VTTPRPRQQHQDSGASLILALGFMLVIGLIGGALAMLVTSGLGDRNTLQKLRNTQYAADGAIELAISQVRLLSCAVPSGSIPYLDATSLNSIVIRVEWVTDCTGTIQGADGTFLVQRNVTFSACSNALISCDPGKVIIRALVNFQQQVVDGPVTKTYVLSWSVNQ
jgi:type II secretory pathway pseudopilin PulG